MLTLFLAIGITYTFATGRLKSGCFSGGRNTGKPWKTELSRALLYRLAEILVPPARFQRATFRLGVEIKPLSPIVTNFQTFVRCPIFAGPDQPLLCQPLSYTIRN